MNRVTFSLFSDLHYIEGYYACTPRYLEKILQRAADNKVDFVMQLGDFSNDYAGSPEVVQMYLKNAHDLPVYGIYGNHELECLHHGTADPDAVDSMKYVTPYLTNRANEVVWGTNDGKPMEDGSIGYYYFDKNGFRFVCLDTFYSYNKERGEWEHNRNLYVRTKGNSPTECTGDEQRAWMERVLTDAAHKGIPCVVFSHPPFIRDWNGAAGDAERNYEIFQRVNAIRKGTVIACINGHLHTDHALIRDNILFLDINVVCNGYWKGDGEPHYTEGQTFEYAKYDAEGRYLGTVTKELSKLYAAAKTWFFTEPLSAIVTITEDGTVTVDGSTTEWMCGVEPPAGVTKMTQITSGVYKIDR